MPSVPFHTNVSLRGFHFEDFSLTVKLSGVVSEADIGKAVTIDTTADTTFKLAGDGDVIYGRLSTYENRVNEGKVVGAVEFVFSNIMEIKSGSTVTVGQTPVGAGAGLIKAAAQVDPRCFISKVDGNFAVVTKI